jgi:hypothetical protein
MKITRVSETNFTEDEFISFARSAFSDVFPNPERIGCPDPDLRRRVALQPQSLSLHWEVLDHISMCGPCFAEHLAFRRHAQRRRTLLGVTVAIGFLLAGGYASWRLVHSEVAQMSMAELRRSLPVDPPPAPTLPVPPVSAARLDYSSWSVTRGETSDPAPEAPPVLRRGKLAVTIQLPLMSPAGMYRVVLSRRESEPIVDRVLRARIIRGDTLLDSFELDTASMPSGIYNLNLRRAGSTASQNFPIHIE